MYILYGNIKGWKALKEDKDIHEIVDELTEQININEHIEYLIIDIQPEQNYFVASIQNMEDYNVLSREYGYGKRKIRKLK